MVKKFKYFYYGIVKSFSTLKFHFLVKPSCVDDIAFIKHSNFSAHGKRALRVIINSEIAK